MITIQDKATFEQAVESLKFLSDGNRLRILASLAVAETCVCDLIDDLELSQTLVSYHLAKLRKAGLVKMRREAQWAYYSLDADAWQQMIAPLAMLFTPSSLPPEAAFGASHRCDFIPADPERGACDCEDGESAPIARADGTGLSPQALDHLTEEVFSRLLQRFGERPGRETIEKQRSAAGTDR